MNTYRFRSSDTRGEIQIKEQGVNTDVTRSTTKWKYFTPFTSIHPNPVYSWTTPVTFWVLFIISLIGIVAGTAEALGGEERAMPVPIVVGIISLSTLLLCYAMTFRREEWVAFPTEMDGIWVRYCRSGPDRDTFDAFTDQLTEQIRKAQPKRNISNPLQTGDGA